MELTKWEAVWRCDMEEVFTVDSGEYLLPTQTLSEAAELIERQLSHGTLIELRRVM